MADSGEDSEDRDEGSYLGALLLQRLKSIREGEIAATSKAAGVADRYFRDLRSRDRLNVTLSTFEKLLRGLGITAAQLVEGTPEQPQSKPRRRASERVRSRLNRAAGAAETLGGLLREMEKDLREE